MFTRTRYQNGSLRLKKRGNGVKVWEFRCYEPGPEGNGRRLRAVTVGMLQEYPTEAAVRKSDAVQAIILRINAEHTLGPVTASTMGALIARYKKEELPTRYSTRVSYLSYLDNYIRPRWGETPIAKVRAMAVEDWLKGLTLAPKTRGHIKSLMSTLFASAQRWELIETNPMQLVRVKNVSKRLERPCVLTAEEFYKLLAHIREPYRTMVLIAGCLGLRASEIVGLQWRDFDFETSTLLVERGVVHGRIDDVKTEYSRDVVPIDPELMKTLLAYRDRCYPTKEGWLFANPTTEKPYHQEEIQKKHIRIAAKATGIKSRIGWKTFRHSYRSWLDQTEAPMGVQRELMRHASIQTTMNVYGRAVAEGKRQAHSSVVQMVMKEELRETATPSKRGKTGTAG